MNVLLVEDEKLITATLADALRGAGHEVEVCVDGAEAREALSMRDFQVVITDVRLPRMNGFELFEEVRRLAPGAYVIFMTAFANLEDAVRMMKAGAHDYIAKPFDNEDLLMRVKRIEEVLGLREENERLKRELAGDRPPGGKLVGRSKGMREVYRLIESVAPSDCTVLIQGESGTGKTMVAEALHGASPRAKKPFGLVSCAALPETLIESELFGHVKGAFTDARVDKMGRFEAANGGTIFIDDVDDLTPAVQVKLLRILQERKFERLGDTRTREVDVRVIAASKTDLWPRVKEGRFREDLFFRLNVVKIPIPPLRERAEDIAGLVGHFLRKFGKGREYKVTPTLLEAMQAYAWPGNVRELEHAVERAVLLSGPDRELKREHMFSPMPSASDGSLAGPSAPLKELVARTESDHVRRMLKQSGGHRGKAAAALGITRKELWLKMKKYGIE
jgi:DNA-binding NtrC family response regulator